MQRTQIRENRMRFVPADRSLSTSRMSSVGFVRAASAAWAAAARSPEAGATKQSNCRSLTTKNSTTPLFLKQIAYFFAAFDWAEAVESVFSEDVKSCHGPDQRPRCPRMINPFRAERQTGSSSDRRSSLWYVGWTVRQAARTDRVLTTGTATRQVSCRPREWTSL